MKILERRETWIHTHFVTDCIRLPSRRMQEIKAEIEPFLHQLGIVYGIHFKEEKGEKGIRIVLECIPFPPTLETIQIKLQEVVKDIPAAPQSVQVYIKDSPRQANGGKTYGKG